TDRELATVFWLMTGGKKVPQILALGTAAWTRSAFAGSPELMKYLPWALSQAGRYEEAGRVFLEGLRRGYPVTDYRPRWDAFTLNQSLAGEAARIFARRKERYERDIADRSGLA